MSSTRFAALALALALPACSSEQPASPAAEAPVTTEAGASSQAMRAALPSAAGGMSGTVKETMSSGGYTYVLLDTGAGGEVWLAAPQTQVTVGSAIEAPAGSEMRGFTSKTLGRTFDQVFFVSSVRPASAGAAAAPAIKENPHTSGLPAASALPPAANPHAVAAAKAAPIPEGPVDALEGGLTVAGVYAEVGSRTGQEVGVRGRVVKLNRGILGADWLHLRDGSGTADAANNDLTVTAPLGVQAKLGDVVVVRGKLAADKDFGAGYVYPVVVEEAQVTVD